MARKETGLSNLTEEQLEELRQIFENERNKNDAWESAKKKIGGLEGSMSIAKKELIDLGIISEIESLGFTSVNQYKVFVREQESLPTKDQDKQLATLKHCPTPTEGLYTDVWHFNEKAMNDRQNLLQRANAAARESKRSYLPYIYIHGFGMSFDELKTLMNANGFVLDSRMESYCDKNGDLRTKKVDFFVDKRPQEVGAPEREHNPAGKITEYNVDERRKGACRLEFSVSGTTKEMFDKLLGDISLGVPINKPRKSSVFDLIVKKGIESVQESFDNKEIAFVYENKKVAIERMAFVKKE